MDQRLLDFTRQARAKGMDFATLRGVLESSGWKEKQIAEALCAEELGIPVPEPAGASSARDTLVHVLSFIALYSWVIAVVCLFFDYVNLALPDPSWRENDFFAESTRASIRWSLATVVVSFPLFLLLWRSLLREMARHPEKTRSVARVRLTYLSLLVGALTLLSDVITLVYTLFEGELTLRFLLKAGLLFAITGTVFVYLALTLRPASETTS